MATKIKTEDMNTQLRDADERLHVVNAQMTVLNDIRSKIEDDYDVEALLADIQDTLKVAVKTKANILQDIQNLHLQLAERHMKLTEKWAFVEIKKDD